MGFLYAQKWGGEASGKSKSKESQLKLVAILPNFKMPWRVLIPVPLKDLEKQANESSVALQKIAAKHQSIRKVPAIERIHFDHF